MALPDQPQRFVASDLPYGAIPEDIEYTFESIDPICHHDASSMIRHWPSHRYK